MTAIISAPAETDSSVSQETDEAIDDAAISLPPMPVASDEVFDFDLYSIGRSPYQPRKKFDPDKLQSLADSIQVNGLQEPVVVTENRDAPENGQRPWRLVSGERRWRAHELLGLPTIKARVIILTPLEEAQLAITANKEREDTTPLEDARAAQRILDDNAGLSVSELAKRLGKNRSTLANELRLLKLPARVLDMVDDGQLDPTHARALLRWVAHPDLCVAIAREAVKRKASARELEQGRGIPFSYSLQQDGIVYSFNWNEKYPECKECPFGAYLKEDNACLRPSHAAELRQAARDAEEARIKENLARTNAAAQKAREAAVGQAAIAEVADVTPDQAAKESAKPALLKKDIIKLDSLPYGSYSCLDSRSIPPTCTEACECRGVAADRNGNLVQICTRPRRLALMKGKDTKAKKRSLAEELAERQAAIIERLDTMPPRTLITVLAARTLQSLDIESVKTQIAEMGMPLLSLPVSSLTDRHYSYKVSTIEDLAVLDADELLRLAVGALIRYQVNETVAERTRNIVYLDFLQAPPAEDLGSMSLIIPPPPDEADHGGDGAQEEGPDIETPRCLGCGLTDADADLAEYPLIDLEGAAASPTATLCTVCSGTCQECGREIPAGAAKVFWSDGDILILHDDCDQAGPKAEHDTPPADAPERPSLADLTAGTLPCEGCSMAVPLALFDASAFRGADIITTPDGRRVTEQNHVLSADGARVWCDVCGRGQWDRSLPHGIAPAQADADPDRAARELAEENGLPDLPAPDPDTGLVGITHVLDAEEIALFASACSDKVFVKGVKIWAVVALRRWRDNRMYCVVKVNYAPRKTHVVSCIAYEAVPHKDMAARAFVPGQGYIGVGVSNDLRCYVLQGPEVTFSLEGDPQALLPEPEHPPLDAPYIAPGPSPDYPLPAAATQSDLDAVIAAGGITSTCEDGIERLTCWGCGETAVSKNGATFVQFHRDHKDCKKPSEPEICIAWTRVDADKPNEPSLVMNRIESLSITYHERRFELSPGYKVETRNGLRWIVSPGGFTVPLPAAIERGIAKEIPQAEAAVVDTAVAAQRLDLQAGDIAELQAEHVTAGGAMITAGHQIKIQEIGPAGSPAVMSARAYWGGEETWIPADLLRRIAGTMTLTGAPAKK